MALAPHVTDSENLAGSLLVRLPSTVAVEIIRRLGPLAVLRPPDATPQVDRRGRYTCSADASVLHTGLLNSRYRCDLADPEDHACATALLTLAFRERRPCGASPLAGCLFRAEAAWTENLAPPAPWRGEPTSDIAYLTPRRTEILFSSYVDDETARIPSLRARVGRHLFICRAHKARTTLEERESALHKETTPHDERFHEEAHCDSTSFTPEQADLARDSPHVIGLMVALHWAQASTFARSALFIQKLCRKYFHRRAIQSTTMAERIDRNLREYPGLSPLVKMIDQHVPERPMSYEEAVATLNAILRDKIFADESAEAKRQAKMPFPAFLLSWHTMRYGACYMARTEQGQLLAFVQNFVRAWRHDGDKSCSELTRHVMASRMKQCCTIMGIAPLQVHLYSPIVAEQYVLILRRLASRTTELDRALGYDPGAEAGRAVELDVALDAITGASSGVRDEYEDGVAADVPSTWDCPVLLSLTGDAMLLALLAEVRARSRRGVVDRTRTAEAAAAETPEGGDEAADDGATTAGGETTAAGDGAGAEDGEEDEAAEPEPPTSPPPPRDARVVKTDELLDCVLDFLLARAAEMHTRLVRVFEKVRKQRPRLPLADFNILLVDYFSADDVADTALAASLYEGIGVVGTKADGSADRSTLDDKVGLVIDPIRAATALWNAGIFPTSLQSHRAVDASRSWPFVAHRARETTTLPPAYVPPGRRDN